MRYTISVFYLHPNDELLMNTFPDSFAVIVVGGGHAGTEACLASARMGLPTLLLTHNLETLGQMSCNPAIGGIGKGHLVKEIDALGGLMGQAADHCGIQFRTLNASKGPAVQATRAQIDRALYRSYVRQFLENQKNLWLFQQAVEDLILEQDRVVGVVTQMGLRFHAQAVVLTVGTFLGGRIHIGLENYPGGRAGDPPAIALAERLRKLPFQVARLKTGTPPRIDGRTVDFSKMQTQPGDDPAPVFSYLGKLEHHPRQVPCYITHTNLDTHEIIRGGLDRSPLFQGVIEGVGPRYCPSIEDKITRFADKDNHQIFIEPEGLNTHELYPNGISTSLPFDIQLRLVRSIVGLEKAHICRPGYAIEYDFFDPRALRPSLETLPIGGLFFAGQINGTTGYEEAAAQGLLAGVNAGLQVQGRALWHPRRDESYLGVMVDDLITRGTNEPYRMFTSRAEYRLLLREDNADLRLTALGREFGLIDDERWARFQTKHQAITAEQARLHEIWIVAGDPAGEALLGQPLRKESRALELLRRPGMRYAQVCALPQVGGEILDAEIARQVEIQARYHGYIERQTVEIARQQRHEETTLPVDLDYRRVRGLSTEVSEKLNRHKPASIAQASRISGITPAAISLLLVHLKRLEKPGESA